MKRRVRRVGMLLGAAIFILHSLFFISCSETIDETTDEYANWLERNDQFFATLEDSLHHGGGSWKKIKTFTKNEATAGNTADYIYAKVLETGSGTVSPLYTDTVRISYRGRLIPSVSYAEGFVFDETYFGSFSWQTTGVAKGVVSSFVEGFTTAVLYMHRGDRWRVYIPHELGYDKVSNKPSTLPNYSTLIFDLALVDFTSPGTPFAKW